jgi:hypothetical protein
MSTPISAAVGATSRNISSRFVSSSVATKLAPVTLPPGRIDQQSDDGRCPQQFMHQVEPLSRDLGLHKRYTGDIASRAAEAGNKAAWTGRWRH